MTKLFMTLCLAACLGVSMPISEALAQPASTAKKKTCKKGYKLTTVKRHGKKRKICKKLPTNNGGGGGGGTGGGGGGQTADPKTTATALISGQQFYRPFATVNISGDEIFRFCADGRYFRRYTSSSSVLTTEYQNQGTWTLTQAAPASANGVAGFEAELHLVGTYDDRQVDGNIRALVSQQTATSGIDDGNGYKEFTRGPAQSAC